MRRQIHAVSAEWALDAPSHCSCDTLRRDGGPMSEAPHDFGGHMFSATRVRDHAIRKLQKTLEDRDLRGR